MLTEEQVRHIAKLARLKLTDEEIKKFANQLTDVLQYVDMLNEVDVEGVEPTSQVTGLKNVQDVDVVKRRCDGKQLLQCSTLPIERNQIKVKQIISE